VKVLFRMTPITHHHARRFLRFPEGLRVGGDGSSAAPSSRAGAFLDRDLQPCHQGAQTDDGKLPIEMPDFANEDEDLAFSGLNPHGHTVIFDLPASRVFFIEGQ